MTSYDSHDKSVTATPALGTLVKGFRAIVNGTVTELGTNGEPHQLLVSDVDVAPDASIFSARLFRRLLFAVTTLTLPLVLLRKKKKKVSKRSYC